MSTTLSPDPEIFALIGRTPLLPLRFGPEGLTIFAKCEFTNPSGSIKDRLALTILCDRAERYYSTKLFMESPAQTS